MFVTRQLPGTALHRLRHEHEVEVWPERLPPPASVLAEKLSAADAVLTLLTDRLDAHVLAQAPKLKAIANYAVGYDNIDLAAAAARSIAVGNTPDVLTDATADLAFALLLAVARNLAPALHAAHTGDWMTWEPNAFLGADVHGATLGIIGFGRIGQAVARRATGFDMRVIHDPLDDVLRHSDFITLHVPLTPQTHHLINAAALKQMKPTAILVNTSRGPVIDQAALIEALRNGTIAGAALDVTDPEPPAADDPLLAAPNLLLTPHIGSATRTARERMADMAVDNLLAALAGQPMPHPIDTT